MLLTCEQLFARSKELHFDFCIIGSGAAGLCLANELLPLGCNVAVLEAGRHRNDSESQSCYITEQTERIMHGADHGRFRVPGGSTTRWGGQALPFDAIDFEKRDWAPLSGWPIGYREVAGFYPRASRFMGLDESGYSSEPAALLGARQLDFNPELVCQQFSKFSPNPDLHRTYVRNLRKARNLAFVTGANVTSLLLDASGQSLASVQLTTFGGTVRQLRAHTFLLCCGAIENARLLMLSRGRFPEGIGNAHGWVGRCFQDHPGRITGTVKSSDPDALQDFFNIYYRCGTRYKPRFSPSEAFQREKRILNASGVLLFEPSPESAFAALKDLKNSFRTGKAWGPNLIRSALAIGDAGQLGKYLWSRVVRGRHYNPGAVIRLAIGSEQAADPESRILLSSRARDRLGLPRAAVQWRLTSAPARAIWEFSHVIADELNRLGLGAVVFDSWFSKDVSSWKDTLLDNNHHMGTTRMGADPTSSVVDEDCRVHTVANLYIGGSSVFPTGGHSNPTLTLIALALRLADHLKKKAGASLSGNM